MSLVSPFLLASRPLGLSVNCGIAVDDLDPRRRQSPVAVFQAVLRA